MKERAAWSFIGMVFGALGGWLAHSLLRRPTGDEERPPIIVRGGSITFETERGWTEREDNWRPDHDEGKPVKELVARVRKTGVTGCEGRELRGKRLVFDHVQRFRIIIAGAEPMVTPRGLLRRDSSGKRVGFEQGPKALGLVTAFPSHSTESVAEDEEVCVCFEYDD